MGIMLKPLIFGLQHGFWVVRIGCHKSLDYMDYLTLEKTLCFQAERWSIDFS